MPHGPWSFVLAALLTPAASSEQGNDWDNEAFLADIEKPCLLDYYAGEGDGGEQKWEPSWFLTLFEGRFQGKNCNDPGNVPCLQDRHGKKLEINIMKMLTVNLVGPHFEFFLKACPLLPFYGTIFAALTFHDPYLVLQAIALLSLAQRAASIPTKAHELKRWGKTWMAICSRHWPVLPHITLGELAVLIKPVVLPECDLRRAFDMKFYHLWTNTGVLTPLVDWVCGANLGHMPRFDASFEEWQQQLRVRIAARPRLVPLEHSISKHPDDQKAERRRIQDGYGADAALLDHLVRPPAACDVLRQTHGPCCTQPTVLRSFVSASPFDMNAEDLRGTYSFRSCNELGWPDATAAGKSGVYGTCGQKASECKGAGSHQEASSYCRSLGARLCTADELLRCEAAGTGCGYDLARVWTSTACEGGHLAVEASAGCRNPTSVCASSVAFVGRCCADMAHRLPSRDARSDCEAFCCGREDCWGCSFDDKRWNAIDSCFDRSLLHSACDVSQKRRGTLWGHWLEFGVYYGATLHSTAYHLARIGHPQQLVYGFDSLQGLVEEWGEFKQFEFTTQGERPTGLPPNAKLVVGWFNETLPEFLSTHFSGESAVQWLHLDCDTYIGHSQVLRALSKHLVPGTMIVFDDILNYQDYQKHALLALYEFIQEAGWSFEVTVAPWRVDWKMGTPDRKDSLVLGEWSVQPAPWWLTRMRALAIRLTAKGGTSLRRTLPYGNGEG